MKFLSNIIAFCCASWMTIYLFGLNATDSAKFDSVLIIFPLILFSIVIVQFYNFLKNH